MITKILQFEGTCEKCGVTHIVRKEILVNNANIGATSMLCKCSNKQRNDGLRDQTEVVMCYLKEVIWS